MSKIYELGEKAGRLVFNTSSEKVPEFVINGEIPSSTGEFPVLIARMGDPELLCCAVYRDADGGFFSVRDAFGTLFVATAPSGLVYSLALARFGEMVANARYGADIFEDRDEDD